MKVHSIETLGTKDGPGIRLVIFLQGCNFNCLYCQNPDTQALATEGMKIMSNKQILKLLEKEKAYFKDRGGLTISGGEPTLQVNELISLFKLVKKRGFHIALDTNGSIYNAQVNRLYDLTDLVILDVKHIDEVWHKKITGASVVNVLKNAWYREKTGKPMWLRYVLVPGYTDQKRFIKKWCEQFKNYKTIKKVEILPYHKLGEYKFKELGRECKLKNVLPPTKAQIKQASSIFSKYFNRVEIG